VIRRQRVSDERAAAVVGRELGAFDIERTEVIEGQALARRATAMVLGLWRA
jgi:hypothetical protein